LEKEINNLPPLPGSILKIQQLTTAKEVNINDLIKVIASDPMLSANILKSVNSPLYGMSKEVSSIQQAVSLFGVSMIRSFAVAAAIKKAMPLDLSPYGVTVDMLTQTSMLQMALSREWIGRVDKELLPLLESATFLMELGKLITAHKLIKTKENTNFLAEFEQGKSIQEAEYLYFGTSSYDVLAKMFRHWNFDIELVSMMEEISDPILSKNHYSKILHVISKAINIRECFTPKGLTEALTAIEAFGFDRQTFEDACNVMKLKIELKN
jgi:HD-like signal output (HDOD) protein